MGDKGTPREPPPRLGHNAQEGRAEHRKGDGDGPREGGAVEGNAVGRERAVDGEVRESADPHAASDRCTAVESASPGIVVATPEERGGYDRDAAVAVDDTARRVDDVDHGLGAERVEGAGGRGDDGDVEGDALLGDLKGERVCGAADPPRDAGTAAAGEDDLVACPYLIDLWG